MTVLWPELPDSTVLLPGNCKNEKRTVRTTQCNQWPMIACSLIHFSTTFCDKECGIVKLVKTILKQVLGNWNESGYSELHSIKLLQCHEWPMVQINDKLLSESLFYDILRQGLWNCKTFRRNL